MMKPSNASIRTIPATTTMTTIQARCYLCEIPKQEYSLIRSFSEIICRGCLNYEGPDQIENVIKIARQSKGAFRTNNSSSNNNHFASNQTTTRLNHLNHSLNNKNGANNNNVNTYAGDINGAQVAASVAQPQQLAPTPARTPLPPTTQQPPPPPQPASYQHQKQAPCPTGATSNAPTGACYNRNGPFNAPAQSMLRGAPHSAGRPEQATYPMLTSRQLQPAAPSQQQAHLQASNQQAPSPPPAPTFASLYGDPYPIAVAGPYLSPTGLSSAYFSGKYQPFYQQSVTLPPNAFSPFYATSAGAPPAMPLGSLSQAELETSSKQIDGNQQQEERNLRRLLSCNFDLTNHLNMISVSRLCNVDVSSQSESPVSVVDGGVFAESRPRQSTEFSYNDECAVNNKTNNNNDNNHHNDNSNNQQQTPQIDPSQKGDSRILADDASVPSKPAKRPYTRRTKDSPETNSLTQQQQLQKNSPTTTPETGGQITNKPKSNTPAPSEGPPSPLAPTSSLSLPPIVRNGPSPPVLQRLYDRLTNIDEPRSQRSSERRHHLSYQHQHHHHQEQQQQPNKQTMKSIIRDRLTARVPPAASSSNSTGPKTDNCTIGRGQSEATDNDIIEISTMKTRLESNKSIKSNDVDSRRPLKRPLSNYHEQHHLASRSHRQQVAETAAAVPAATSRRSVSPSERPRQKQPSPATSPSYPKRNQRRVDVPAGNKQLNGAPNDNSGPESRHKHQSSSINTSLVVVLKCLMCQERLDDRHFVQCPSVAAHKYCFACSKISIEKQQIHNKRTRSPFYDKVFCPSGDRCFLANESKPWTFMNSEIETIFRESDRRSRKSNEGGSAGLRSGQPGPPPSPPQATGPPTDPSTNKYVTYNPQNHINNTNATSKSSSLPSSTIPSSTIPSSSNQRNSTTITTTITSGTSSSNNNNDNGKSNGGGEGNGTRDTSGIRMFC